MSNRKSKAIPLIVLALILILAVVAFSPPAQRWVYYKALRAGNLLVMNTSEFRDNVAVTGDLSVTGAIGQTGDQTVTGDFTVTGDTTLGNSATADTLTVTGNTSITGARDATTGYDYFLTVEGDVTGTLSGAKTYGVYIDMERTVANASGNIDDAGLKLRYKNSATSRVAGIVQTGADIEAKNDDGHWTGVMRGAQVTAVTDEGGYTDEQIALRAHAEIASTAAVTAVQVADFELNRKSETEPTTEYGVNVRNTSSAGTGADVGYRLETSAGAGGSAANADWTYGLDFSPATITTAEIRMSNEETISNLTNGLITLGGDFNTTGSYSGNMTIAGARDATTGYDYFLTVEGDVTGTLNGAKTYGIFVDMERTADTAHGNIDDAGIKVRYKTSADNRTAGIVETGGDFEGKVDDGHKAGTIRGLVATAVLDDSATADAQVPFRAHAEIATGATATAVQVADFELNRKSAEEPTTEYGINLRNTSSAGTGADVGYRLESSFGAGGATANADWLYGIDLEASDIVTADIKLSNGETIKNTTDTAVQIGGFLALTEGAVVDLGAGFTLTPTASYQPITNSGAGSITSDGTTSIVDGAVAGAILVVCNEDDQDIVFTDNTNIKTGGNVTLAANTNSCMTLLWDGADWLGLAVHAN